MAREKWNSGLPGIQKAVPLCGTTSPRVAQWSRRVREPPQAVAWGRHGNVGHGAHRA